MTASDPHHLLDLTRQLLDSVRDGDWAAYQKLCAPSLTCFEPESLGHLIEGMEFHRFYFELGGHLGRHESTVVAPHVQMLGEDAAVVAYVRVVQFVDRDGEPRTRSFQETRVWERQPDGWRQVHFHRG